jgi:hypothetical protein
MIAKEYRMKVSSRREIIKEILELAAQKGQYNRYICFNVKIYQIDLSFDNLIETYKKSQKEDLSREFLSAAKVKYDQLNIDDLYNIALERAREGVLEGDYFRFLLNGMLLDIQYDFIGRSGGHLSIETFNGYDLSSRSYTEFISKLEEMKYSDLKNLYRIILRLKHDLTSEKIRKEIEIRCAFDFVENVCGDLL